jgi:hypothetical protein
MGLMKYHLITPNFQASNRFRNLLLLLILLNANSLLVFSQSQTLFSDSVMARVNVWISPDSLDWLYAHPISDQYLKADMVYEDGVFSDTIRNIGFRLRGNTSRFSRKKSYKISFNTFLAGRRYQGVKKLNLNGQHNDPTMIREKLFYQLWNKAGMPKRRCVFVKLFVNDLYMGLYTGLEEMDKDWLQRVMGNNSGNLYKCTYPADLVYQGSQQDAYKSILSSASTGGRAYSLETNEAEDDYSDLVQLCARLHDPLTASFQQNIESILDVDAYLKALALEIACGHWDDYAFNKNNYFLYHNPGTGRFHFISYDADNTFGVDWFGIDWATRNLQSWMTPSEARPLLTKVLAFPPYLSRFYQIADSLNKHIMHPDSNFKWIDWAKSHISEAAAADSFRCLDYGYTWQDFNNGFTQAVDNHTPIGIKPFLQNRFEFMQQELAVLGAAPLNVHGCPMPFPNPFRSRISLPYPGSHYQSVDIIDFWGGNVSSEVSKEENSEQVTLDFGLLPKGLYHLILQTHSGVRKVYAISSQ